MARVASGSGGSVPQFTEPAATPRVLQNRLPWRNMDQHNSFSFAPLCFRNSFRDRMPFADDKERHLWVENDRHSPVARERGVALRASVFLLHGRVHFAARTSPAECRLREAGALHFADVVFDGDTAALPERRTAPDHAAPGAVRVRDAIQPAGAAGARPPHPAWVAELLRLWTTRS